MSTTISTGSRQHGVVPPAPAFAVELRIPTGGLRLRLSGELDIGAVAALEAAVTQARAYADGKPIVLDLSAVELLSSAAARVLIDAQRGYRDRGGTVVVQHVPAHVDRCLRSVGLDERFEILDPGAPAPVLAPARQHRPMTLIVEGTVTPWTVTVLLHRARPALAPGARVGVDLRAAVVPSGRATVSLGAALRRLAEQGVALEVTGAPPALALVLEICAAGVELPDRRSGHL